MTRGEIHSKSSMTFFLCILCFSSLWIQFCVQSNAYAGGLMPDLSTGAVSYSIPIEVPAGRRGMAPALALTYRSGGGDGQAGVGWELETGSIERNTKNGLFYNERDTYVLRIGGATIELVNISGYEYRAKIEGPFFKVTRVPGAGGDGKDYWIVKDKSGTLYRYGYNANSRQDDQGDISREIPPDPSRIFKWCLDRVTDTNGNYVSFTYSKDSGQIYIDQIDYTGNIGDAPTKSVKFYTDNGIDFPEKYDTKFRVKTTKRLKTIAAYAEGHLVRAYALSYSTSPDTNRNRLISVQQFGSDATLDTSPATFGAVLGGTALPATTFEWTTNEPKAISGWTAPYSQSASTVPLPVGDKCRTGDLDGDGKTDFWCESAPGSSIWDVALSTGSGWMTSQWNNGPALSVGKCLTGDLDGDGKTDFWCKSAQGSGTWDVALSTGSGWTTSQWNNGPVLSAEKAGDQCFTGDLDRDGKTDFWCETGSGSGVWSVALSTQSWSAISWNGPNPAFPIHDHCFTGDLDADGKTDFWCKIGNGSWKAALSTDAGWTSSQWDNGPSPASPVGNTCLTGDLNADGKTDLWCETALGSTTWSVALSTGERWATSAVTGPAVTYSVGGQCMSGDLSIDGKTDFWCETEPGEASWSANLSKGYSQTFWDTRQWYGGPLRSSRLLAGEQCFSGDLNGDGMTDMWCGGVGTAVWRATLSSGSSMPDLLESVKNGIGGTTTISYALSNGYPDTHMPFPFYTVSVITTNDGNGLNSTTNYDYAGGYYHIGERDFRGFNRVTVTGPEGPNHVRVIVETWFHRGNDTRTVTDIFTPQAYIDDPTGIDGYMKGRPYFMRVTDSMGQLHSVSTTVYYPPDSATSPYFTPDRETNSYSCDDGACERHMRSVNTYDNTYGNLLRTDDYGEVDDPSDDRTIMRTYAVNAGAWIVGLPSSETLYKGIGTAVQISKTTYYYDGVPPIGTSCGSGSFTGNEIPDRGLVTRVVRWLDPKGPGQTDPEERMAYDSYGNLACSWDAEGNPPLSFSYDETHTYRRFAKNPLRHKLETRYYGVDNEPVDNGVYGQVKSAIDPNGSTVESYYDPLGRQIATFFWPEGTWISWTYPEIASSTGNTYGVVGAQHVMTNNVTGNKTWTYFDGLGRTILEKKTGPNDRIVEVRTVYNENGTVKEQTMPAFAGVSNVPKSLFTYDARGRITDVTNPDGMTAHMCYRGNITTSIDADKHRKRTTLDARGRLVKVEEYLGTYDSCSTEEGTPFATMVYEYDLKVNLVKVIDTSSNETRMEYDSLGRKIAMHDPDMGDWKYEYDRNGHLSKQTDANNNSISLTYDELGRVTLKDYPTGTDIQFRYDETTSTYSIGRLTAMIDASGTTTFNYDYMGRPATMTKHIDGSSYTITNGYENARLTSVTYPDGEIVRYSYGTGSELNAVYTVLPGGSTYIYAMYPAADYTALSQPKTVIFGNGVETTYDFYTENNRLKSILTSRPSGTEPLLSLAYEYTNGGNIKSIDDLTAPGITSPGMTVSYTYRLNDKPHAVRTSSDGGSYGYDNNGNMTGDGVRTLTYDYDNRLQSAVTIQGTTTFVYDGAGTRVKKIGPNGEYVYIGKYYQCKDGTCIKYIYGGDSLIADQVGTDIQYYHQDHLGSTRVVTNDISEDKGSFSYYPFGETLTASGALGVVHQYTSQELDSETNLYFYNARYYNPILGRFITADTIVPEPGNSQSLNRYSYVYNNPLNFVDPTGHYRISISAHQFVGIHFSYDSKTHDYQLGLGGGYGASIQLNNFKIGSDNYLDLTAAHSDRYAGFKGRYFEGQYGGSTAFGDVKVGYGGFVRYFPDYGEFQYQCNVGLSYSGSKGGGGLNVGYSGSNKGSGEWTVNGSVDWTDTIDSLKNKFSVNYDFKNSKFSSVSLSPTVDGWGASYDFVSGKLKPVRNNDQIYKWAIPLIPDLALQLLPDKAVIKIAEKAIKLDMATEEILRLLEVSGILDKIPNRASAR